MKHIPNLIINIIAFFWALLLIVNTRAKRIAKIIEKALV